jgi:putative hydrolase of the HAD superfamily
MLNYIDHRIDNFMQQKLNLTTAEITRLRSIYWQKYGTTLTGLMLHHHIKPDEYIQNTYNINIADFLKPDPTLAKVLENISFSKAIFSNSPREYIQRVLRIPIYVNRDLKQVTQWEIREIYDLEVLVSKLIQSKISA